VWAGSADHRNDQVPRLDTTYFSPNFDNLRERFVPEDEVVGTGRRITIFERGDLTVRATETYLTHSEQHVRCALQVRFRNIEEINSLLRGEYCEGLHGE
jgi:hypothetical protein